MDSNQKIITPLVINSLIKIQLAQIKYPVVLTNDSFEDYRSTWTLNSSTIEKIKQIYMLFYDPNDSTTHVIKDQLQSFGIGIRKRIDAFIQRHFAIKNANDFRKELTYTCPNELIRMPIFKSVFSNMNAIIDAGLPHSYHHMNKEDVQLFTIVFEGIQGIKMFNSEIDIYLRQVILQNPTRYYLIKDQDISDTAHSPEDMYQILITSVLFGIPVCVERHGDNELSTRMFKI